METRSLFKITEELQGIIEHLLEHEGELTPEIESSLSQLDDALKKKSDGIVDWIKYQESLIDIAKQRRDEMISFIKKTESRIEKFSGYINNCLMKMEVDKIEGDLSKIVKRKPSEIVIITDEKIIPFEYIKVPELVVTIDKVEIKKALKSGIDISGAKLGNSEKISIAYKIK